MAKGRWCKPTLDSIPLLSEDNLLEQTKLPRGGVSMDTKAVGRVQVRFGYCPPGLVFSSRRFTHPSILPIRRTGYSFLKVWYSS